MRYYREKGYCIIHVIKLGVYLYNKGLSEKEFFNNNEFKDFEITFINEPLNSLTQLTEEQWNETDIISVFISSSVTEDVIHKFC